MARPNKPWKRSNGIWYTEVQGKQINLGRDKKAAFVKYRELLREQRIGPGALPIAKGGAMTARELIDAYGAWLQDNRAPSSWEVKRYLLTAFQAFLPPTLPASEVKPFMVEAFFKTQGKIKSPTTKHDKITSLIRMFNWAVEYGVLESNPIANMPKPTPRVRQDFIPADKFAELLEQIKSEAFGDFTIVMLESGARTQEMFDFEAGHYSAELAAFTLTIEDSKGNKRSRVVYLPERAKAIVERLILANPDGKLFRNSQGNPWNKDSVNCQMRRLKVKLNMPGLCATTLRHSYAHWRLTQGQDAMTVAKLMGHVDTRMLARRYGHLEGSKFLAAKAQELSMPLPEKPASAAQEQSDGCERNGRGDGAKT